LAPDRGIGSPGDIAWVISTSRNSLIVLDALKVARERGLSPNGLTGRDGGRMTERGDIIMVVLLVDTLAFKRST